MSSERFFLLKLLKRYALRLLLVFLCNLVAVLLTIFVFLMIEPFCKLLFYGTLDNLSPISSFFLSPILSAVSSVELSSCISLLILLAIVVYLLKSAFTYLAQWFMASVRSDLLFYYRNRIFNKILLLPLSYFNKQKKGDIISRAVSDTQEIEHTILGSLKSFMTEPVSILFFVSFLFCISPRLTLYSLALLPVSFLLIALISSVLRKNARTAKQRLGSILSHVEETLGGLRIVKGFNSQRHAEHVFHRLNDDFTRKQTQIYRRTDLASPLSEFLGVTIVMIVLVIGGSMVLSQSNNLSASLFITYIALFTQVITPVKNFSTAFANYKRGLSSLDRVNEILDADVTIQNVASPIAVSGFENNLSIENLSFSYNQNEVLSGISINIHKGDIVALVGQSGSGKSTLVDLLERFYDPDQGTIYLDGIDVRQYELEQYHALFALVSQDVVLFNDSLYNNITLGYSATEEKVMAAIRVANIESFIQSLPDGLNHHLSDRGLNLSGGQRQRISIARAVLRNAPILILDEATSAMDTESERQVQKALDEAMKNRTVVVIAHRLSTIQKANQIIVLDHGRIVEQGTHDELLQKGGQYQNLIKIQNYI